MIIVIIGEHHHINAVAAVGDFDYHCIDGEMTKEVVQQRGMAIRVACQVLTLSESCYRYEGKRNAEDP